MDLEEEEEEEEELEEEKVVEEKRGALWNMGQDTATDTVAKEDQSPWHKTQSTHQQRFPVEDLEDRARRWPHLLRKTETGSLTEKPSRYRWVEQRLKERA